MKRNPMAIIWLKEIVFPFSRGQAGFNSSEPVMYCIAWFTFFNKECFFKSVDKKSLIDMLVFWVQDWMGRVSLSSQICVTLFFWCLKFPPVWLLLLFSPLMLHFSEMYQAVRVLTFTYLGVHMETELVLNKSNNFQNVK